MIDHHYHNLNRLGTYVISDTPKTNMLLSQSYLPISLLWAVTLRRCLAEAAAAEAAMQGSEVEIYMFIGTFIHIRPVFFTKNMSYHMHINWPQEAGQLLAQKLKVKVRIR